MSFSQTKRYSFATRFSSDSCWTVSCLESDDISKITRIIDTYLRTSLAAGFLPSVKLIDNFSEEQEKI